MSPSKLLYVVTEDWYFVSHRLPLAVAALAAALEKLIGDAALRRRMGEQSRVRAETEFGQETVIAQTLAVYREAYA